MNPKNLKLKKFHVHTVIRWMVSVNCFSFGHGAQTEPFPRQRNTLKVRVCSVFSVFIHVYVFECTPELNAILSLIDKLITNLSSPSTESLGPEYSEMKILDLDATWSESEPRTPLVCILSIGSDPTSQIATLAKNKNIRTYKLQIARCT